MMLLAANLSHVHAVLLTHMSSLFTLNSSEQNASGFFRGMSKLRINATFISEMKVAVSALLPEDIPIRYVKPFIQRLLTELITNYFKRQNELINREATNTVETLTENDKQVVHYICGYLIHSLRKKYFKIKNEKAKQLQSCLNFLTSSDTSENVPSAWTDTMNRGGLKKPCAKFFTLIIQTERWVREVVNVKRLNSDSLVNLKSTLLEYNMLKVSWEKILPGNLPLKWTLLEHVISLFLKVRGFAVTKLIRKTLKLQHKTKSKAGSKQKSLRTELKAMTEFKSK